MPPLKGVIGIAIIIATGGLTMAPADADCTAMDGTRSRGCDTPVNNDQLPDEASGHHSILCTYENTKRGTLDQSRYDYCIKRQDSDYIEWTDALKRNKNIDSLHEVLNRAITRWTRRGARNDMMVNDEIKSEVEYYKDYQYEVKQPDFNVYEYDKCHNSQGNSYFMTFYCYKLWKDHQK